MAFKEYLAVLDSDLYEYCGTTKAILARIAHLIIAPPKEDDTTGKPVGEPNPDVGFCTASQAYLGCQLGLSESKIRKAIRKFEEDNWIVTICERDKYGHAHNKYRWADGAWDRLAARKRQKTENGEYIRTKQVNMMRHPKEGRFVRVTEAADPREPMAALPQAYVGPNPPGYSPDGRQADSAAAARPIALRPPGRLPVKGVELSKFDLEGEQSEINNKSTDDDSIDSISHKTSSQSQKQIKDNTRQNDSLPEPVESVQPPPPVHPASPPNVSAAPRKSPKPDKPVCKRLLCGGPLKPNGECKKCGASSKPDVAPVRVKAATAVGYGADGEEEEYELCSKCERFRQWMGSDLCRRCYQQENP